MSATNSPDGLAAAAGSAVWRLPEKEWPPWSLVNRVSAQRVDLESFANGTKSQRPGAAGAQMQTCVRDAGIRHNFESPNAQRERPAGTEDGR